MTTTRRTRTAAPRPATVAHPFRDAETLALLPSRAVALVEADVPLRETPAPRADWGAPDRDPVDDDPSIELRGRVAVVSVEGPLVSGSSWWCESYENVLDRVRCALASPKVDAVVMSFDSPGGTTAGFFDAMRSLRSLRSEMGSGKRMVAHTGAACYSAAYGLAAQCDEIVVSDTAGVGSVGVIATLVSRAKELEAAGIDVAVVSSGTEKTDGHPAVPITSAAKSRMTKRVAELANAFAAEVAAARTSVTSAALLALDGGVRYGREAVGAGLADRVASLDALVAQLEPARPQSTAPTAPGRAGTTAADPSATRRSTMHEAMAALIAAKTQETDPERQMGALQALFTKAEQYDTLAAEAAAAKAKAEGEAFERELGAGLAARKITEAEAGWWRDERTAGRATSASLNANLARRPAAAALAADSDEHRQIEQPKGEASAPAASGVAAKLLAKPYGALTWDERNTLAAVDPAAHDRVFNAWVAAGRPKG